MEHDFLRGSAARERRNLVFNLLAAHQVMVAVLHLHGVAQRAGRARNNRNLLHRRGVRLLRRHQRVTDFVVRNDELFARCENRVFLLIACNNNLDALLKVGLRCGSTAVTHGAQRSFVHNIRKLCAGSAGSHARDLRKVNVGCNLNLLRVHTQNRLTARKVGQLHRHAAVKTTRTRQGGVKRLRAVRRGKDNNAVVALKAVHFGQKLI